MNRSRKWQIVLCTIFIFVFLTGFENIPIKPLSAENAENSVSLPVALSDQLKQAGPTSNSVQNEKWKISILSVRKTNDKLPISFAPPPSNEYIIITANIINLTSEDQILACISEGKIPHESINSDLYSSKNEFAILAACRQNEKKEYIDPAGNYVTMATISPNSPAGEKFEFIFIGLKKVDFQFLSIGNLPVIDIKVPGIEAAPAQEKTLPAKTGKNVDRFAFSGETNADRDIYLINSDNSNLTRLTNIEGWDWSPVWSPDGTHIAFLSMRTGNSEIFVMDSNGSNLTQMTDNPAYEGYPVWSPDGKTIAFVSERDDPDPIGCASSSNGCTTDIYLLDTATLAVKRITDSPFLDDGPTWSPDGKRIAFSSNRNEYQDIYTMKSDGSDVIQLTSNKVNNWRPAWSPDGKHIAYATFLDEKENIYLMDPDGKNQTRLTTNIGGNSAPNWSPDSKSIVFNFYATEGSQQICKIQISNSVEKCLEIDFKIAYEPTWQPYPITSTTLKITLPTQKSAAEDQSNSSSSEAIVLVSPETMKVVASWNKSINAFTSASDPIKDLSGLTAKTAGFWNNSKLGLDLYKKVVKLLDSRGTPWKEGLWGCPDVNEAITKRGLRIYFTDDSITEIKDGKRIIFKSTE